MSASLDFPSRPAAPRKTGLRNGPRRIAATLLGLAALLAATPASAVTLDNGVVLITQADALAGGVTPGDAPGFPITLSVTGSYRFASSLLVNTAVDGIQVTAPEVTIDFAGFRMAGSGVGVRGIFTFQRALSVKNGTIRGFTQEAIASIPENLTVNRMRIVDNPIAVPAAAVFAGSYSVIKNSNISRNNIAIAVQCSNFCRIQKNIFVGTGVLVQGISIAGNGTIITGNTVANFGVAIAPGSASIGDNVFIGNTGPSQAALLPLDPNQP